jgi:hypothetical protein
VTGKQRLSDAIRAVTKGVDKYDDLPLGIKEAWCRLESAYRAQYEFENGPIAKSMPWFHELELNAQTSFCDRPVNEVQTSMAPWRAKMLADCESVITFPLNRDAAPIRSRK